MAPVKFPHYDNRYDAVSGIAFFGGFIALFAALLDLSFRRGNWDFRLPMLLFISGYICLWSGYLWWFTHYAD